MFKVGDKVKCTSTGHLQHCLTLGKVYEVMGCSHECTTYIGDNGEEQSAFNWRFELVKPESQAAAIAGGLQEHSVGEYYPLAAVMYEHNGETIITIENLQTGEVNGMGMYPLNWGGFEQAYRHIERIAKGYEWSKTKGRVSYASSGWVVAEPANPVQVTRLRNMLHRG